MASSAWEDSELYKKDRIDFEDMGEESHLCSTCKKIDFQEAYSLSNSDFRGAGNAGIAISETITSLDPHCAICSFIASCYLQDLIPGLESSGKSSAYHLRALESSLALDRYVPRDEQRGISKGSRQDLEVIIVAVRGPSKIHYPAITSHEYIDRGIIMRVKLSNSRSSSLTTILGHQNRIILSSPINYDLIDSWIGECCELKRGSHHICTWVEREIGFVTRVIDCLNRRIVPLKGSMKYLALSYVWGPQAAEDSQPGLLDGMDCMPQKAPATIEDAMSVVRRLRKRYLWVDRYCIKKSENPHRQIENMDQIYRNAITTIVAVDATDVHSGLRGVSSPRSGQFRIRTKAGLLVSSYQSLSAHFASSVWVRRGWTYQEAILSRSCLFFTRSQVYFACKMHVKNEVINRPLWDWRTKDWAALGPYLLSHPGIPMNRYMLTPRREIFLHAMQYSSRSLTFECDALSAFKGIIASQRVYTYWGTVPIIFESNQGNPSDKKKLCYGLCFGLAWISRPRRKESARRRTDFPTWSWLSVADQTSHEDYEYQSIRNHLKCSDTYIDVGDGQLINTNDLFQRAKLRAPESFVIAEHGKALFIDAQVAQISLRFLAHNKCRVISPYGQQPAEAPQNATETEVVGNAYIDCVDDALSSSLESRTWHAIKLFWITYELDGAQATPDMAYWMIIDHCFPVAHRVGVITPRPWDDQVGYTMEDLPSEKKMIRIE